MRVNEKMKAANRMPEWQTPKVMALGKMGSGHGKDGQLCTHGNAVKQVCGNGSSPEVDQCKSGNVPPSTSCASGNQGT